MESFYIFETCFCAIVMKVCTSQMVSDIYSCIFILLHHMMNYRLNKSLIYYLLYQNHFLCFQVKTVQVYCKWIEKVNIFKNKMWETLGILHAKLESLSKQKTEGNNEMSKTIKVYCARKLGKDSSRIQTSVVKVNGNLWLPEYVLNFLLLRSGYPFPTTIYGADVLWLWIRTCPINFPMLSLYTRVSVTAKQLKPR